MNALNVTVPSRFQSILHLVIAYIAFVAQAVVGSTICHVICKNSQPASITFEYKVTITAVGSAILGLVAWMIGVYFVAVQGFSFNVQQVPVGLFAPPLVVASSAKGAVIIGGSVVKGASEYTWETVVCSLVGAIPAAGIAYVLRAILYHGGHSTQPIFPPQPPGGNPGVALVPLGVPGGLPSGAVLLHGRN